jgi:hypothetical protein
MTSEEFDRKIEGRRIERLTDVRGVKVPITLRCLVEGCNNIWRSTPDNTINKKCGCPLCFRNNSRLTNEEIDKRLEGRPIKRIGDYQTCNDKILWLCLTVGCGRTWLAVPNSIVCSYKTGCPTCRGKIELTPTYFDQIAAKLNLSRVDEHIKASAKIRYRCTNLDCNEIAWIAPTTLKGRKDGCSKCSGCKKLAFEEINKILEHKQIILLQEVSNTDAIGDFKHLKCGYEWKATVDGVIRVSGCPFCAGNLKLSNEIIDNKLIGTTTKRIGNYINIDTPIDFQCLDCGHIRCVAPNGVLNQYTSCRKCYGTLLLTKDEVIAKIKEFNKNIVLIGEYINCYTNAEFACLKCDHHWLARPSHIMSGTSGCPNCKNKNEARIQEWLIEKTIDFTRHISLKKITSSSTRKIIVDFYIPSSNIIIEYNGGQHYKPVQFGGMSIDKAQKQFAKQQERDQFLEQFCKDNNIKLVWIDGRQYYGKKLVPYLETLITILVAA